MFACASVTSSRRTAKAFSMVELLVVIAIIVIVIAAVATVSTTVRTKAKIRNTQATIQILVAGLQAFKEDLKNNGAYLDGDGYFLFPLEPFEGAVQHYGSLDDTKPLPNGDGMDDRAHLQDSLNYCFFEGASTNSENNINFVNHLASDSKWDDWNDLEDAFDQNMRFAARGSVESLYYFLSRNKAAADVIGHLDEAALTNSDGDSVIVLGRTKNLIEVNDAWGRPLRYRLMGPGNFPEIRSAGPDGRFDGNFGADDIVSNEF